MIKYRRLTVVFLFFLTITTVIRAAWSESDNTTSQNVLNIKAVKMMNVVEQDGGYQVLVHVIVANESPFGLRLQNGEFEMLFNEPYSNEKEKWRIGATQIKDKIFSANKEEVVELVVNNVDINKIIKMTNIIGDPGARLSITLRGATEIGLEIFGEWVFPEKKFEIELIWTTGLRDKILLLN